MTAKNEVRFSSLKSSDKKNQLVSLGHSGQEVIVWPYKKDKKFSFMVQSFDSSNNELLLKAKDITTPFQVK